MTTRPPVLAAERRGRGSGTWFMLVSGHEQTGILNCACGRAFSKYLPSGLRGRVAARVSVLSFLLSHAALELPRTDRNPFLPYPSIPLHTVICATACRPRQCPAISPRYVFGRVCLYVSAFLLFPHVCGMSPSVCAYSIFVSHI